MTIDIERDLEIERQTYIKNMQIEMEYTQLPDQNNMFRYLILLTRPGGNLMEFIYQQGKGHVEARTLSQTRARVRGGDGYSLTPEEYKRVGKPGVYRPKTVFMKEVQDAKYYPAPPKLMDALWVLVMGAQSINLANGFEDWAEMLCYNPDSRKDHGIYEKAREQSESFVTFLGGQTSFNELEELFEDY